MSGTFDLKKGLGFGKTVGGYKVRMLAFGVLTMLTLAMTLPRVTDAGSEKRLGPGHGLAHDARRGPVCWDYFNGVEHLLLKLRMLQFERTSSYQAFGILFTEEGPYPINGNGELTGEEFQMTLTLNAFLPDIYVSSVQYAIRLKAPTLDGLFDSIAPTLFPEFQAFRISGTLTYLGNRCELPEPSFAR